MKTLIAILKRWPFVHAFFLLIMLGHLLTPNEPFNIAMAALSGAMWIFMTVIHAKRLSLLLCLALLAPDARAQERPTQQGTASCGMAVAVVVIVVGGVVVVKFIRYCKKKLSNPKPPSDPYGVWEGSSCVGTKQSCAGMADVGGPAVHVRLSGGTDGMTIERIPDAELVEEQEWESSMAAMGFVTHWGSQSWVRDGQRVDGNESRILIHSDGVDVRGDDMRTVRIQRSFDLVNWEPLTALTIPAAMSFEIDDSSERGAAYYRRGE